MAEGLLGIGDLRVVPTKQPTFVLTLPQTIYKARDDGGVELRMLLPIARAFAESMLKACLEMEEELKAKCG